MWLNNYTKIKNINACGKSNGGDGSSVIDASATPIQTTTGAFYQYISVNDTKTSSPLAIPSKTITSQTSSTYTDSDYKCNLIIGTGTTPVTVNDYCLESEITNLTCSNVTSEYILEYGTVAYKKIMQNTLSETIIISEIGIVTTVKYAKSANAAASTIIPVLVYREVLETPIVVAAGETFVVSITHKLPTPV